MNTTGCCLSCVRTFAILLCWLACVPSFALGQTTSTASSPDIGSTLTAETLADLPIENVLTALETTQSEVISDRFNASGLNVGENARLGGFLGSWSQTLIRIGDIDVTDPSGSGAPLLFPDLMLWNSVKTSTGLMPIDFNAPGLGITLTPIRPASTWRSIVHGSWSGGRLASPTPGSSAPPIARLNDFGQVSALFSGPLTSRVGLVAGGSWVRASKFLREVSPTATSDLASGVAHVVYAPSAAIESRTLALVQRTSVPFAYRPLFTPDAETRDRSVHVQSTLDAVREKIRWNLTGGVTERRRENDLQGVSAITADRLTDGPIPAIAAASGNTSAGRWAVNGRVRPQVRGVHAIELGGSVDRTFLRSSDQFDGTIGELVDTTPARRWFFTNPGRESRRHATTATGFVSDRLELSSRLTVDAGVRVETISGTAEGAASGVGWHSVLPRVALRWRFGNKALIGGYRRSANQLNLDLLAYGDPNGETAVVTRFLSAPLAAAAIIDRVGPGTGGNASFSAVDAELKRPSTDEYVVGIESSRHDWFTYGLTGVARREANLLAVVDGGVPLASYSTIGIADPGHDFNSAEDDQILKVYNRLPESYGRNQYLLTNSGEQAGIAYALKLWATGTTGKLYVLFGATASMATAAAANRGYGPLENDQDTVGELLTDPNATTFARGRLFSDRAFTIKWTTIYRFPKQIDLGVIARYQDGQPFARLVPAPDLNQGKELVRAYANAGNRFTFTGTLDIRIQKRFAFGRRDLAAILDFYNLATRSNEVEEYTVSGAQFRTPTAIEPPRSVHLGLRLTL